MGEIEGDVELTDVSFSYEEGHPILKHINLYARPGQTIAFVGPTGAGKNHNYQPADAFFTISTAAPSPLTGMIFIRPSGTACVLP